MGYDDAFWFGMIGGLISGGLFLIGFIIFVIIIKIKEK